MGADVIKIEEPGRGDESRAFGPPFLGGEAPYYLSVNRGKRSCTLNLKCDKGKAVLWRLLDGADVLVENFRPGAMARLGLDYETVAARYPRLVYCSISGFGGSGPDAGRPGYDLIVQGESGLMDLTGDAGGPPTRIGTAIPISPPRRWRRRGSSWRSSRGTRPAAGSRSRSRCSTPRCRCSPTMPATTSPRARAPRGAATTHPSVAPYQTLRAKDGWMNLAIANDSLWRRYCDAIARPDLRDDPRSPPRPSVSGTGRR